MVKLRLRNGKSEGRLRNALRFFYGCNLFRFGGEKGKLTAPRGVFCYA